MSAGPNDPAAVGTLADVQARLLLWCRRATAGLSRVEFSDGTARSQVVAALRSELGKLRIPFHEVILPSRQAPSDLPGFLVVRLRSLSPGVVSVSGFEEALPEKDPELSEALFAFAFNRERLESSGHRQIWWLTPQFEEHFYRKVPDLASWFILRLRLEERGIKVPDEHDSLFEVNSWQEMPSRDPRLARLQAGELVSRIRRSNDAGIEFSAELAQLSKEAVRILREANLESEARVLELQLVGWAGAADRVSGEPMVDFFISYTKSDEAWAEWIAWELEDNGYKTRLMAWDFRPGSDFVAKMHEALKVCGRTIAVLSPRYLNSAFCLPEWTSTFASDPTGMDQKLVPVRITDCQPDGLLTARVYIDLVGLDERDAREKLLDGVGSGRAKPDAKPTFPGSAVGPPRAPFPGALPPIWSVPFHRNQHFTGRVEILTTLEVTLRSGAAAVTQPLAVHGLGGIGKTQLAVEYAWRHKADYDAVMWVVADSPENAAANLAGLCRSDVLGLPEAEVREQPAQLYAVRRWLRTHGRWLLILDSVDTREAAEYVRGLMDPAWTGHVIITSRRSDWNQHAAMSDLPVPLLEEQESVDFLLERLGAGGFNAGTEDDARSVAAELGRLPLALEQAAAYILRRRVPFAEYLWRLVETRPTVLSSLSPGGTGYLASVAQTWLVTEQRLSPAARAILRLAAFMAPDDIPRDLFRHESQALQGAFWLLASEVGLEGWVFSPDLVEDALVELADYSLISLAPQVFSCHRLVQAVQRDRVGSEVRKWVELALRLMSESVPGEPDDVRSWPAMNTVWVHIEAVTVYADKQGISEPTGLLLNQLGIYLSAKALHREAESLLRRALAIDEQRFGTDNPKVARDLNNLASLLYATNRLGEAEPMMRRALASTEQSYGHEHPKVATHLNNLAQLLKATNRLEEAEPLIRRALAINEASNGPNHPSVARVLNNLGQLLLDTNRWSEAEPLIRRALAIDETIYGPNHPRVAESLSNLSELLMMTSRLGEAEKLARRGLEIEEASYGYDHPTVATGLNNLAQLMMNTKRLEEAEPLIRRALAINEASFGPDHPKVASNLSGLGLLLQDTERLAEAEPLMRRALQIAEASYGSNHPVVAKKLNDLAQLLKVSNRLTEAEQMMRRALEIDEVSYGLEHPNVAERLNNLALLLFSTGRLPEAEPLIRRALEIDEASYGPDHPAVAIRLNNLAQFQQDTGRTAEAEPLMRRHVVIFRKFAERNGREHPFMQKAILNYRNLLEALQLPAEEINRRIFEAAGV